MINGPAKTLLKKTNIQTHKSLTHKYYTCVKIITRLLWAGGDPTSVLEGVFAGVLAREKTGLNAGKFCRSRVENGLSAMAVSVSCLQAFGERSWLYT